MNVGSICSRNVVVVEATNTLQYAAGLMRENHVGALVVVRHSQNGSQAIGIITDRDLVVEGMALAVDPEAVRVGEITGGPVTSVPVSASLDDAIRVVHDSGVRRLLVTNADGRLVGIVSLDDLLGGIANQMAALSEGLRAGLARETSERGRLTPPDISGVQVCLPEAGAATPLAIA